MPQKRVLVVCHEPIAIDPTSRQGWADVWIRFKAKPGRSVYRWAPTLVSRSDLVRDLELTRKVQTENPDLDFVEEVRDLEAALERLKTEPRFVDDHPDLLSRGIPTIYTAADTLDRREAEAMLDVLLARLGQRNARYHWKRPGFVVIPV